MELRIKQEVINRQNRFLIVDEKDNYKQYRFI